MVNIYTKNKNNVGTIGARLHFSDDTIQHAGMISWVSPKKSIEISHRGLRSYYNYEEFGEVIGNTGAFLMINKTLFKNLNGFNENYIECFEDVELNMKCIINNKKNYFVGSAVCYHYESISRGKSQEAINRLISDYKNNLLPFIINNKKIHKYIKGLNNN
jgi:GT2 family glycosyltransferase